MILNLAHKDDSEVLYVPYKYPDGQQSIKITAGMDAENGDDFLIKSRLNNFMDLEMIVCATKAINGMFPKSKISLFCPYFLGGRSDRKFEDGMPNYLRDVICPIIKSLNFESVFVLDPHSYSIEMGLSNYRESSITCFHNFIKNHVAGKDYLIVCPDKGATNRVLNTARNIGYLGEIVFCDKIRDSKGNIVKTEVPHFDLSKHVLIIDDICDGGKTFTEIANIIRLRQEQSKRDHELNECGELILAVTHGIFSKGTDVIYKYFDSIICTNSYSDNDSVKQLKII